VSRPALLCSWEITDELPGFQFQVSFFVGDVEDVEDVEFSPLRDLLHFVLLIVGGCSKHGIIRQNLSSMHRVTFWLNSCGAPVRFSGNNLLFHY